MFLWLAAAAVPIAIHFWYRRPAHTTPWAATQFLLAALNKHAKRISLYQLLLLLLRILGLVLLTFALVSPTTKVTSLVSSPSRAEATHWIFVVDSSYSMGYQAGELSRFENAKANVIELCQQAGSADEFSLIGISQPAETIVGTPVFDRDDFVREVKELTLTKLAADLDSAISQVAQVQSQAAQDRKWGRCRICLFTDLAANSWEKVAHEDLLQRMKSIAKTATFSLHDMGTVVNENRFIVSLKTQQWVATTDRTLTFDANIRQQGDFQVNDARVHLYIDNRLVDTRTVSLSETKPAVATFEYRFPVEGEHSVRVSLDDDFLLVDNQRWLTVNIQPKFRILCVGSRPEETKMLATAIQPDSPESSPFSVVTTTINSYAEEDLTEYDTVCFCNIRSFSRQEGSALRDFIAQGGGAIFVLGDRVQPQNYNEVLVGANSETSILPGRLLEPSLYAQYRFDPLEYQHSIVAPFRGFAQSGLLTTPVWKYIKVQPLPTPAAATPRTRKSVVNSVLNFVNGDPALLEHRVGAGNVLLYTGALSSNSTELIDGQESPWTALASWPSFLPLVQEMINVTVSGRSNIRNRKVNDSIEQEETSRFVSSSITVTRPDGTRAKAYSSMRGTRPIWSYGPLDQNGVYRVESSASQTNQLYSVNLDTAESDLTRIDSDAIPEVLRQPLDHPGEQGVTSPEDEQRNIYQYLLVAVLCILGIESFLAWWFGKPSRMASP